MNCADQKYNLNEFLSSLFHELENKGVIYVVLRNYKTLPYTVKQGGDIDFLIDEGGWHEILSIIKDLPNCTILISSRREFVHEFIVEYSLNQYIKLDFHPFEDWRGAVYLSSQIVLSERKQYKNFYIPSDFHQACTMILSNFIHSGVIKAKYLSDIDDLSFENDSFMTLNRVLGYKNVNVLKDYICHKCDEKALIKRRPSVLFNIFMHNIKKYHFAFLCRFLKILVDEIVFRWNYNGLLIRLNTMNKEKTIREILDFFSKFVNPDRVIILSGRSSIQKKLKIYDDLARLRFVLIDDLFGSTLRTPDIEIYDDTNVEDAIKSFLIKRTLNEMK